MRILIVENGFKDLKRSRMPLGSYFQSLGNEVIYACPDPEEKGIYSISMSRNSFAPFMLINGLRRLKKLESDHSIEAVLSFRFIPNVLNYLVSFRRKSTKRVAVITGLGYAFTATNKSFNASFQYLLIKLFYRIASKRIRIISQNPDDLRVLGVYGEVILGSGVKNVDTTTKNTLHTDSIKLLYVGRLLKSKGILTAIEVFEQLRGFIKGVSLTIAGTIDGENPDSLTETELKELRDMEGVNYLGYVNNIDSVYGECNVLLFPSIYREGVPRVIIESLKYGYTIVTKDMPGCKEAVDKNGFLMLENSTTKEVVDYILRLDPNKLLENQKNSVELFNSRFSSNVIYPEYLDKLK